jgi:hypothetical protein
MRARSVLIIYQQLVPIRVGAAVGAVWKDFHNKKISLDEARDRVVMVARETVGHPAETQKKA